MNEQPAVVLGQSPGNHLTIRPLRRMYPRATDFWDGNWLACDVEVRVGGFHARVEALLRTEDFTRFRAQLADLYAELRGGAAFRTMEDWLKIDVAGDGRGHLTAVCELRDEPGFGNALHFAVSFDQTELATAISGLEDIDATYATVGSPDA